jgi:hypothetical protein
MESVGLLIINDNNNNNNKIVWSAPMNEINEMKLGANCSRTGFMKSVCELKRVRWEGGGREERKREREREAEEGKEDKKR